MGCGNSTAKFNEKFAAVEIHGLKQSWNGIASAKFFSEPNVLQCKKVLTESSDKAKVGGQLLDGAGTVLLDVVPYGDKAPQSALGGPDTARGASTRSLASRHTGLSKAHVSGTLCLWCPPSLPLSVCGVGSRSARRADPSFVALYQ